MKPQIGTHWAELYWVGAESFTTRDEQQARLRELAAQTTRDAQTEQETTEPEPSAA